MKAKYSLKLHDDTVIDFELISKDVFEKLLAQSAWTEYTAHLTQKCSLPFSKAYRNSSEYLAVIRDNDCNGYAIHCLDEQFFELLEKNSLIFFSASDTDLSSQSYMLIISEREVTVLKKNHCMSRFGELSGEEQYYELDDGRYMILFNDGGAEVFMNREDMEVLDRIIG